MSSGATDQLSLQALSTIAQAIGASNQILTTINTTLQSTIASQSGLGGAETTLTAVSGTNNLGASATVRVLLAVNVAGQIVNSLGTTPSLTRVVRFGGSSGNCVLVFNATTLWLPNTSNISTATDDQAIFVSDATGNWRLLSYLRKSAVI